MRKMFLTSKLMSLCAMLASSACGGSSSSAAPVQNVSIDPVEELLAAEASLAAEIAGQRFTDTRQINLLGTAVYQGTISGTTSSQHPEMSSLTGEIQFTTDFSRDDQVISGLATNLFFDNDDAARGQLQLQNGRFNQERDPNVDHTFSGSLEGILVTSEHSQLVVSLGLEGDFFGENANYLAGGANGILTYEGKTISINGRFISIAD